MVLAAIAAVGIWPLWIIIWVITGKQYIHSLWKYAMKGVWRNDA